MSAKKKKILAYLLFGPGQSVLQLPLLVEESLVLPTQRRETSRKLVRELCNILLRLITHGCVSREQQ